MGNTGSRKIERPPAKVLVLSHDDYQQRTNGAQTPMPRPGNQKDVENLKELFQRRGIKSLFHKNFTKQEILTTLKYFCEVEVNPNCMAVVVMTHGSNRGILEAKDDTYRTWDVYEALLKCKTKYRLIFFIACRGNAVEQLVFTNDKPTSSGRGKKGDVSDGPDSGPFDAEAKDRNIGSLIVRDPDFLVVYCTADDRVSFRNIHDGTWYINTLCQELNKMSVAEDIMSLLTRVNQKVSEMRSKYKGKDLLQTPCIVSTLTSEFTISYAPRNFTNTNSAESSNTQLSNQSHQQEVFEVSASEVHCLMYHSSLYEKEAETVTQTIKNIGLQPKQFTEFSKLIKCAETKIGKNKKCLFVVIIAQLTRETYDPSWYIMVDDERTKNVSGKKSLNHVWHQYRNHSSFNGKPKIFLFLDPFTGVQARPASGMQSDGTFNDVPEHFNFLRVYGFGIHFMEQLCLALEKWPHNQRPSTTRSDLYRILLRAMKKSPPVPGQCSYTETTLGLQLILNGQSRCSANATSSSTSSSSSQLSIPAPKATRKRKKKDTVAEQLSNLFTSCCYIVGKDGTKIECDAANHDNCHTILEHNTSSPSGAKRLKIEIELPDIELQTFRIIQNYKRDKTLQTDLKYKDAFDVYAASHSYKNIPHELLDHCWNILINNCNTDDQICSGFNFAVTTRNMKMLEFFLLKIGSNTSTILKCDNFLKIPADTLTTILEENKLNCTEIELFEACVHWCEQQPDYELENLRKSMEPFLGHIRFLTMNPLEFMASKQISDVLSDQEFGAIMKKLNGRECDDWPNTISINTSSRIRD